MRTTVLTSLPQTGNKQRHQCRITSQVNCVTLVFLISLVTGAIPFATVAHAEDDAAKSEFFERRIRPILVRHCYECHSGASNEIKGGLRLDFRDAVLKGGDSGPAIAPGKAEESLLLTAVKHDGLEMPPGRKLSDAEISDLHDWVTSGAFDPRDHPPDLKAQAEETFEALYQDRRQWWSLQPITKTIPPEIRVSDIAPATSTDAVGLTDLDRFIVAKLRDNQLELAPAADRITLARRAWFAVIGLPPTERELAEFLNDTSDDAWPRLVDSLLNSPHFGERWARHWMDVVRYTDTYGYEWDMPAKGAWRYRDYLVRAFNQDIPFDQLIREQIAGDLLPTPRINTELGINESLIGPMFYQMGEKRHGDSAEFDGIHQEMLDNKIDAFGKAFLATTISCARCHDHKLDAISQKDYYALGGLFMSARWVTNTVDIPERNAAVRTRLVELKNGLRQQISRHWRTHLEAITTETLSASLSASAAAVPARPLEDPLHVWAQLQAAQVAGRSISETWTALRDQYRTEHQRRAAENKAHFSVVADFRDGIPNGWSHDGEGLRELAERGDIVVALSGEKFIDGLLLGGLVTNSLSPRMNGAVRTPWTRTIGPGHLSFEVAGGEFAARRVVVDNAFLTERQQYVAEATPKWQMVDGLGSIPDRNVYVEFATKTSNPNFPPRVGLGGACSEEQAADPRSWFQISRVVKHVAPFSPHDELGRVLPLFEGDVPGNLEDAASRYRALMVDAVSSWTAGTCTDDEVRLLNWMLSEKMVPNDTNAAAPMKVLLEEYRTEESKLREPETVNGMASIDPPYDYRLNIRGEYDQLGDPVPHGAPRLLAEISGQTPVLRTRLELAQMVASADNPLTARVYVNRVWHWMFGKGLVATTDDFGHVGEKPSHPELLDHLATQFLESGWSTKQLVRSILLSRTWQQSQASVNGALDVDPTNRLLHHFPVQRLDAESLRDSMLVVSGRFDSTLYGPTTNPSRLNEDDQKRLFSGPLDGLGRRSIYTKVTIMEPPRFLATFNQPAPKIPTGRRDVTTTPAQSLTLLNDPFVTNQAEHWASVLVVRPDNSIEARVQHLFQKALGRDASSEELSRWADAARDFAHSESVAESDLLTSSTVWKAMAHTMFNTKEFLYVR